MAIHASVRTAKQRCERLLSQYPNLIDSLADDDRRMLPRAAWWYRPQAVRKKLKLGFDPHVVGVHDSTPLDRAAFNGYVDFVELLLVADPDPPAEKTNEFGGTPLGACLYGRRHGWSTGHPQNHYTTVKLLPEAGTRIDPHQPSVGDRRIDALLEKYGG